MCVLCSQGKHVIVLVMDLVVSVQPSEVVAQFVSPKEKEVLDQDDED